MGKKTYRTSGSFRTAGASRSRGSVRGIFGVVAPNVSKLISITLAAALVGVSPGLGGSEAFARIRSARATALPVGGRVVSGFRTSPITIGGFVVGSPFAIVSRVNRTDVLNFNAELAPVSRSQDKRVVLRSGVALQPRGFQSASLPLKGMPLVGVTPKSSILLARAVLHEAGPIGRLPLSSAQHTGRELQAALEGRKQALPSVLASYGNMNRMATSKKNQNGQDGAGDPPREVLHSELLSKDIPLPPRGPILARGADFSDFYKWLGGVARVVSQMASLKKPGLGLKALQTPDPSAAVAATAPKGPVTLILEFKSGTITQDLDVTEVASDKIRKFKTMQLELRSQLARGALPQDVLDRNGVTPIASYKRISMLAVKLDESNRKAFVQEVEKRGVKVYENRVIKLDLPNDPENKVRANWVDLNELVDVVKARKTQAYVQERLGPPIVGQSSLAHKITRGLLRFFGVRSRGIIGWIVDSGTDQEHPLLKGTLQETHGDPDSIGHGSHVWSTVVALARWMTRGGSGNAFPSGWGTTVDILRELNRGANAGAAVMQNSWGSNRGDPEAPESKLVLKLAEEGRIMVFAAGNNGSNPNTIGDPAIVYFKDPKTGGVRVVSVAAADRNMQTAYFSSRGPGSSVTSRNPERYKNWPNRPDLTAMGRSLLAAWPRSLESEADVKDPVWGPQKAISGTSIAAPNVTGAILLLADAFGVKGPGPELDRIVNALLDNTTPTGRPEAEQGRGFMNVDAAFEALKKSGLKTLRHGVLGEGVLGLMRLVQKPLF